MREVLPAGLAGERIDRVVAMLIDCSRSEAAALVADGKVVLDGEPVTTRSARVRADQTIEIDASGLNQETELVPDPSVELVVIHQDADVVVIDKPAGLVVHPGAGNPTGTLVHGAVALWPEMAQVGDPLRPGVVHRIDQGTSGLVVLARSQPAYDSLVEQFSTRAVEREYLALAWGHLEPPVGMIDAPIGRSQRDPTRMTVSNRGREARTRYEVMQQFTDPTDLTFMSCQLETGRTHQIRVHLSALGHPLVGDGRYGGERSPVRLARPWLHATRLAFVHPGTGEQLSLVSELPPDLAGILAQLR